MGALAVRRAHLALAAVVAIVLLSGCTAKENRGGPVAPRLADERSFDTVVKNLSADATFTLECIKTHPFSNTTAPITVAVPPGATIGLRLPDSWFNWSNGTVERVGPYPDYKRTTENETSGAAWASCRALDHAGYPMNNSHGLTVGRFEANAGACARSCNRFFIDPQGYLQDAPFVSAA